MSTSGTTPGGKKTGGRKPGTPNKVTFDLIQMLRERGFDPAAKLAETYQAAEDGFARCERRRKRLEKEENDRRAKEGLPPVELPYDEQGLEYLKRAESAAAQLMQYTHPKRKAIEHTGANGEPLEGVMPVVFYLPDNGRSKRD